MTMPNFLMIGAARSGTTALWHYLRQHPQVYMAVPKHTRFFASEGRPPKFRGPKPRGLRSMGTTIPYAITDIESYRALFKGVTDEKAFGEASHSYLYTPGAPERIRRYVPDVKLIAMLRDPAERAYSHYRYMVQLGREPLTDFGKALDEEEARVRDNWWPEFHYARLGFYYAQLKPYFDLFGRDQVGIYFWEDFSSNALGVLQDVFRFLDVDDAFVADVSERHNASVVPKSKAVEAVLGRPNVIKDVLKLYLPAQQRTRISKSFANLRGLNLVEHPRLSPEVRRRLIGEYEEDILKLQQLIGRDLSSWMKL